MKKRKKKVTHRRRRVGAASGMQAVIMKIGGIAAGVFVGGQIVKMVATSLDPKILGGGLLAAGAFVPKFAKGNPLIEGVGYGLAAKGANTLMTSLGVITGFGAVSNDHFSVYRATPKLQQTVGGVLRKPIGAVRDLAAVGAMYDN